MSSSAGAIEAGKAFVSLFVDDSRLLRGLSSASSALKGFGGGIAAIGGGLSGLGASILAPLALAVNETVEYASSIQDAASRTGIAADELQALKFAAEQSGASFEELEKAITVMQRKGLGEGVDDLKAWADEIANLGSQQEQTAKAQEVFGKGGVRLMDMLKGGSAGVTDLMDRFGELGAHLSNEDISAAESFGDSLDQLGVSFRAVSLQVGAALIPALQKIIDPVISVVSGISRFIEENRELVVNVAAVGAGLMAAGAAVTAIGATIAGLGFVLSGIGVALGAVGTAFGLLLSPIGLVIAAFGGLIAAATSAEDLKRLWESIVPGVREFGRNMKEALDTAVSAMQSGKLELAWKTIMTALRIEFLKFRNWLDEETTKTGGKMVRNVGVSVVETMVNAYGNIADFLEEWDEGAKNEEKSAKRWENLRGVKANMRSDAQREQKEAEAKFVPDAERQQKIADLQKELVDLKKQVAEAKVEFDAKNAAAAVAAARPRSRLARIPGFDETPNEGPLMSSSKGIFSGSAIRGALANSDKPIQKIADATKQTADNTKRMADAMDKLQAAQFED